LFGTEKSRTFRPVIWFLRKTQRSDHVLADHGI
jgi:hypothetical protein